MRLHWIRFSGRRGGLEVWKGDLGMRGGIPSISMSSDCAMSNRLSPCATLKVLSTPSLSTNVTCSLLIRNLSA